MCIFTLNIKRSESIKTVMTHKVLNNTKLKTKLLCDVWVIEHLVQ